MKPIWISLVIILIAIPCYSSDNPSEHLTSIFTGDNSSISLSDFEVRQRLDELNGKIDFKYNSSVEKNIRHYLSRRKRSLANVIGKSELYFPLFEHYLEVNNLPDELKYLSVVESALNPSAKSPVGASGLWQFMKGTGLKYGLKVDSYIDERNDPIKATEAAFNYLSDLHKRYNDWTLALAAYNCGPGRVNRAIKRARSMDYWKLRRFLPSETQNYVPAFIAVTYVMNYYHSHGIQPKPYEFKYQNTNTILLSDAMSFYTIAKKSEVDLKTIEKLNPAYKRRYIPRSKYGNFLTLPVEGSILFKDKMRQERLDAFFKSKASSYNEFMNIPSNVIQSSYSVQKGESIEYIAKLLKCSVNNLVEWNKLENPSVFYGQELKIFFIKETESPTPSVQNEVTSNTDQEDANAPKETIVSSN